MFFWVSSLAPHPLIGSTSPRLCVCVCYVLHWCTLICTALTVMHTAVLIALPSYPHPHGVAYIHDLFVCHAYTLPDGMEPEMDNETKDLGEEQEEEEDMQTGGNRETEPAAPDGELGNSLILPDPGKELVHVPEVSGHMCMCMVYTCISLNHTCSTLLQLWCHCRVSVVMMEPLLPPSYH